jgi:hypothetical protein
MVRKREDTAEGCRELASAARAGAGDGGRSDNLRI